MKLSPQFARCLDLMVVSVTWLQWTNTWLVLAYLYIMLKMHYCFSSAYTASSLVLPDILQQAKVSALAPSDCSSRIGVLGKVWEKHVCVSGNPSGACSVRIMFCMSYSKSICGWINYPWFVKMADPHMQRLAWPKSSIVTSRGDWVTAKPWRLNAFSIRLRNRKLKSGSFSSNVKPYQFELNAKDDQIKR